MLRPDDLLASLSPANRDATLELLTWWLKGVSAVEPRRLVRNALHAENSVIGAHASSGVMVLAVGKAATGMAWGADDAIGDGIMRGLVITDSARSDPPWAETIIGGHPIPTPDSVRAATAALDLVDAMAADQLLLALISGGGSALMEIPHASLDLSDVQDIVDQLIRSGAPIETINAIRSLLSQVKAGRLASRCAGTTATLVLSDVLDADPAQIASGPTVAPIAASGLTREVFEEFRIVGESVKRVLEFLSSDVPSTPPIATNYSVDIVADGRTAGQAAVEIIGESGTAVVYVNDRLAGDACDAAQESLARTPAGAVGVFTGETTVMVTGTGRGGRNQHAALAAACEITGTNTRFLACGTDGIDGPTDAAGAFVDGTTVVDIEAAMDHLARCDAYPYLDRASALLRTGPTGTNVGDMWIVDKRH